MTKICDRYVPCPCASGCGLCAKCQGLAREHTNSVPQEQRMTHAEYKSLYRSAVETRDWPDGASTINVGNVRWNLYSRDARVLAEVLTDFAAKDEALALKAGLAALQVIALCPETQAWLVKNDPQALRQVTEAIAQMRGVA